MIKNKIFASCAIFFILLRLNCGMANAQIQNEIKMNSGSIKPIEVPVGSIGKASVFDRCTQPIYPRFAIRHEMVGKTETELVTDSDGRVVMAEVVRSSGWRILDESVLTALMGCKIFDKPGMEKVYVKTVYTWRLDGPAEIPAELLTNTCGKSAFVSFANESEPGRGIVVGVWLNKDGDIERTNLEWLLEPKLNQESVKLVTSCKFKPASNGNGSRASVISVRLLPLRSN